MENKDRQEQFEPTGVTQPEVSADHRLYLAKNEKDQIDAQLRHVERAKISNDQGTQVGIWNFGQEISSLFSGNKTDSAIDSRLRDMERIRAQVANDVRIITERVQNGLRELESIDAENVQAQEMRRRFASAQKAADGYRKNIEEITPGLLAARKKIDKRYEEEAREEAHRRAA